MKPALILAGLVLGGLAVYLLAAWAQRRGWINLRASGGGVTAGLAQVGQLFDPPTRHVFQIKEERRRHTEEGADAGGNDAKGS